MLTEQEQFWSGEFGRSYTERNANINWRARVPFWRSIIEMTGARSILEVGCNVGGNLLAIRRAFTELDVDYAAFWGVDINQVAIQEASNAGLSVSHCSLFDAQKEFPGGFDLVASVGCLIHVDPTDLPRAMDQIISVSNRYVLAVEYAWETEEEIVTARYSKGQLWKRPFGKLYQERGLSIVAEGEAPNPAFDKCAWWLLERP